MSLTRALTSVGLAALAAVGFALPAAAAPTANQGVFTADGVKIRTCAATTCTGKGSGYKGQSVTVYCYKYGTAPGPGFNEVWFSVRDNATGVSGFAHSGGPDQRYFTGTAGVPQC
ncbi:hypothetical protein [Kutzneria sp. 744]|uniref:hypothetical protein n=1 Tax=Kutzneria sp. (strain 744) TaxID=345341 RepID=UPI0005B92AA6|nr:hypothetical protein [Kutzneria sp. 744]